MKLAQIIPHPIPYQGSKRQIAPIILRYIPDGVSRFVEPFAGSAAMSLAVAYRDKSRSFWLNDAHGPIIELWRCILDRPESFADRYEERWNDQVGREREYFDRIRARFNETHDPADFLYLLARCVKAAIRYNRQGEFNNTPDNRRKGALPGTMRDRIVGASVLLSGKTRLTAWDYKKVLRQCESSDIVYMDPPYRGVCGNRDQRYAPRVDHDEFCEELQRLTDRDIPYLVSYDGRTGQKEYGKRLPGRLGLCHYEVHAGRSTQATLLGRNDMTYESLYVSRGLVDRLPRCDRHPSEQLVMFA